MFLTRAYVASFYLQRFIDFSTYCFGLNFVYNYGLRKHEARAEGSKEFFDAPKGHAKRTR
jgi:hypothetical protein